VWIWIDARNPTNAYIARPQGKHPNECRLMHVKVPRDTHVDAECTTPAWSTAAQEMERCMVAAAEVTSVHLNPTLALEGNPYRVRGGAWKTLGLFKSRSIDQKPKLALAVLCGLKLSG